MGNGVAYTELGDLLFELAHRTQKVRGPYRVGKYMEERARSVGYDLGTDAEGKPRKMPQGGAVSGVAPKKVPEPKSG